jgi:hypothetical protein
MSTALATPTLAPEVLLRVGDVTVVLDRRRREVRWQRLNTRSMHLDAVVTLAVAQGLIRAAYTNTAAEVVRFARSKGHFTRIWRDLDDTIWVQTDGPFPGPAYGWSILEAMRVADALVYGGRVLGGVR